MGVYISGVEIPTKGFITLTIRADGFVQQKKEKPDYEPPNIGKAIPVPAHCRLVLDRHILECFSDAIIAEAEKTGKVRATYQEIADVVATIPTIIEAEEIEK